MTNYQIFKIPIFSLILVVEILGGSLASVRAASLNLTNSAINCEESPTGAQSKQKADIDKFLPKPDAQPSVGAGESNAPGGGENPTSEEPNILAANAETSETDTAPIAQLPPNAIAQGEACELVDGQVCGVGGEVCDIGGPIPEGGPVAAAAGFPLWALAPLAGLPFIGSGGGGGGDNNPPPTQIIPEPSTIFGSAIALGLVFGMNKKSKNKSRKQRSKNKTQKD